MLVCTENDAAQSVTAATFCLCLMIIQLFVFLGCNEEIYGPWTVIINKSMGIKFIVIYTLPIPSVEFSIWKSYF